jgi:5'-3' exonuclease
VLYPVKGVSTLVRVDEAEITRRYGIPGRAYLDFALLRGDPSDGLPGVRGIGEKTAAALIAKYKSLDAILAARDLPGATARKIAEGRDYLAAARTVVPPVPNVPIPDVSLDLPGKAKDADRLAALAEEHGLGTPIERVQAAVSG